MSNKYPGGFVSLGGQIPSYSVVFDGTGDYLSVADNTALDMEASDFTMECWFKPNTSTSVAGQTIFGKRANAGTYGGTLLGFWGTDLKPAMYATVNGSSWGVSNVTSSVALTVGVWSHLAFTRSGSTWTIWVNGFATATATLAGTVPNNTSAFTIGATAADGSDTICASNISNVRIVKGTALYTTSFTPPTAPLQNITNTSLLTCQSATLIDNSSNGFTVTASGNAAVSSLQPPFQSYNPNNLNPALGAATPGVWTLSQALAAEVTRSWPMYDPYYKNVVLNLHGNGTNAAQNNTFLDSSTNNFTITRAGNTTQGTFSPYGPSWSNYFNGTSANVLGFGGQSAFSFGTGDFTIEAWIFPTVGSLGQIITDFRPSGTNGAYPSFSVSSTNTLDFYVNSTTVISGGSVPTSQWSHVVVCRSGTSTKLFLNGVQVGSTYSDSNNYSVGASRPNISENGFTSANWFNGYISNFRVVKGGALYTTNFTPPTSPLTTTVSAGTVSALICQSNRLVDVSSNAFTVNGAATVQRFQPFLFNTSYTPSTIGGSGYFDGTGDYLTAPNNAAFSLSADFTIECWWYPTTLSASPSIWCLGNTLAGQNGLTVYWSSASSALRVWSNGATLFTSSIATPVNSWYHVALVRSGTTLTLYINGVSAGSTTNSTSFASVAGNGFCIDAEYAGSYYVGQSCYITDVRVVKGTAITPPVGGPTAPLTAVANTSFLCSMTNGAIYDNAMMNDLETVGNAQISTSVKKYGTGSLYFDGTGDYLVSNSATTDLYAFGTGDFTIEFWLYLNTTSGTQIVYDCRPTGTNGAQPIVFVDAGVVKFQHTSVVRITGPSLVTGTWYHIAVARSGTNTKMFVNGAQGGSTYSSDTTSYTNSSQRPIIGVDAANTSINPLNGYIDDLRITKGVARYVANFTPPTSQLQDQ